MLYRTTGAWGAGKGSKLTKTEIDTNFYELDQRLTAVEDAVAAGTNPISYIASTGTSLFIHMTSGAVYGPIPLPIIMFEDTGKWSPSRSYLINDVFTVDGSGIYRVQIDHTSDTTFDPAYLVGGQPAYSLMIQVPNPAPIINVTADIVVLTGAHANAYVRCDHGAGVSVFIEAGTFTPATEIHFRQVNTGGITFYYGDSGTIIYQPDGFDTATSSIGAVCCLKCVADNEFDLFGVLTAL